MTTTTTTTTQINVDVENHSHNKVRAKRPRGQSSAGVANRANRAGRGCRFISFRRAMSDLTVSLVVDDDDDVNDDGDRLDLQKARLLGVAWPCINDAHTWRSCCFDCCSRRFESAGLLFVDKRRESEYLSRHKSSKMTVAALSVLLAYCTSTMLGSTVSFGSVSHANETAELAGIGCAFAVPFAIAIGLLHASQTRPARMQYVLKAFAVWAVVVCVPFLLLFPSTTLTSANGTFCTRRNYSVDLSKQDVHRLCAISEAGPVLSMMTAAWVVQKILVVLDIVSARLLFAVTFCNAMVLFGGVVAIFVLTIPSELADCVPIVKRAVWRIGFETSFSIIVASGALLFAVVRRSKATRELFYWTARITELNALLRQEADPFSPDNVRQWITEVKEKREWTGDSDQSNSYFWAVPTKSLRLKRQIARGSSGVVWQAEYQGRYQTAAKQLLSPSEVEVFQELAREVALLGQLSHPNIVKFIGLWVQPMSSARTGVEFDMPLVFIVEELCAGNLRGHMRSAGFVHDYELWLQQAVRLAHEIASGMAYLHARQIVHSDLKPENILLTTEGRVRLADFGVSSQQGLTVESRIVGGTLEYMAPEMFAYVVSRSDAIGAQPSDVYSFGIIVWELLMDWTAVSRPDVEGALRGRAQIKNFRRIPKQGTLEHLRAIWELPPITMLPAGSPAQAKDIIPACCSFEVDARPTFADVCNTMDKVLTRMGVPKVLPTRPHTGSIRNLRTNHTQTRSSAPGRVEKSSHTPATSPVTLGDTSGYDPPTDHSDLDDDDDMSPRSTSAAMRARMRTESSVETNHSTRPWLSLTDEPGRDLSYCNRLWTKCRAHFPSNENERRFSLYMHNEDFYRIVRIPYVVICVVKTMVFIAWAIQHVPIATYIDDVFQAVLFFAASVIAFYAPLRQWSNAILFPLALITAAVTSLNIVFAPGELNNFTTWQLPNASLWEAIIHDDKTMQELEHCAHSAGDDKAALFAMQVGRVEYISLYGHALFDLATLPVVFIVLGLPVRHYVIIIVIPLLSCITEVCFALLVVTGITHTLCGSACHGDAVWSVLGYYDLVTVVVAGLLVYASCAFSAWRHEMSRRKLFMMYYNLQVTEIKLARDADSRRYRETMLANRASFGKGASDGRRPKSIVQTVHSVRTTSQY